MTAWLDKHLLGTRYTYVCPVLYVDVGSVADAGYGAFFTSESEMGKKSGSGMINPDHISESLETILGVEILTFFFCRSGIRDKKIGSGIRDGKISDPG
jgi:hypothetical protein